MSRGHRIKHPRPSVRPARSAPPCDWPRCLDLAEDSCEHGRWCAEHGATHHLERHLRSSQTHSLHSVVGWVEATRAREWEESDPSDAEALADETEAAEYARLRPIPDANRREHCRRCRQPVVRRSDFGWYCADCLDNAAEAADSWGEAGSAWLIRFEQSLGPLAWISPAPPSLHGLRRRY